jgi:hypothetical protein
MQVAADAPAYLYAEAWIGLGIVLAYYVVLIFVFRSRIHRSISVTQYEPPTGISPAVAANLRERGLYERAFASALVSLSAKGFLEIGQDKDRFSLKKLQDADGALPPEESMILGSLFAGREDTYAFDSVEYTRLCDTYIEFKDVLEGIVEPELISAHSPFWLVGVALSLIAIIPVAGTIVEVKEGVSWASVAYFGIWILLGGSCLVATLRVWPVTFRKLTSYLPWDNRPSRPLDVNDAIPVFLSASALAGLIFLAVLSSINFALLITALVLLNAVSRHALEAPTRAGRRVLTQLENFREFLSRTDSDRFNRENQPGKTPVVLEKYSAYAVALGLEYAWGEEIVGNLVELLELDQAYSRRQSKLPINNNDTIELKIGRRR